MAFASQSQKNLMAKFYREAEKYLDQIDPGAWVEIGVDRGEGSTSWLCNMAEKQGSNFYAVDIDPDQINRIKTNLWDTDQLPAHVNTAVSAGETFLENFSSHYNEPVSLVYLDNFDWNYWVGLEEPWVLDIMAKYRDKFDTEMTNLNSQISHLRQAMALIPLFAPKSLVICDDTWLVPKQGIFSGKCSAAIPLLMGVGFSLLEMSGFEQGSGVILGRL